MVKKKEEKPEGKQSRLKRFENWLESSTKRQRVYQVVMLVAIMVIITDVSAIVGHIIADHKRQVFIAAQTSALGSKNVPSSVKPTVKAVAAYTVPPTLPKYLIIPAIHVDARVAALHINAQNQIQAPANIYDTGWYVGSSLPGQPGAMFIDGHVSSWTADGVFYNLKTLRPGDAIQVVRGDNTTYTYIVRQVQSYGATNVNMSQVLSPIDPGTAGLNLMTCTGSVISGTSEFNERLVVYSTLQA